MDEVIIKVLNGGAEPLDDVRLAKWRSESPENERHFHEVSAIWRAAEQAPPREHADTPRPTGATVIRQGEMLRRRDARRQLARAISRKGVWPLAAAAVLATVSLGVWVGRSNPFEPADRGTEFMASNTGTETIALPDGSFVRLAPGSAVRFASDDSGREAWLTGRAFFAVDSDADRPFLVHTDLGDTRVLGTRFEVDSREEELTVTVVEGHVAVTSSGGRSADVRKDQIVRLGDDGAFTVVTVENAYALLDWPDGVLIFQSTPLLQVTEEVGARFGVTIELTDPALTRRTLTAWFADETMEEVIDSICLLVGAECESVDGRYRIGG